MGNYRQRKRRSKSSARASPFPAVCAQDELEVLRRRLSEVTQELHTYREETHVQTEQLVKAQSLLEKSRDRYADLFDFAPMPYMILDRWGVIVEVNLPGAALLQYERSRIVGFPLRRFVELDDRSTYLNHMRRCRKEMGRVTTELRLKTSNGEMVPVELTSRRALDREDSGEAFPTAIADLSERNRTHAIRNDLLAQLMAAEERERQRLSREVHDVLGQHITALILGLGALESATDPTERREKTQSIRAIADQLGQDAHRLALNLRPTVLDDLGLESALAGFIDDWSQRTGTTAQFQANLASDRRLPPRVETMFYRVGQEALTNVAKHAAAKHVNVILKATASEASMVVEDDGCGLDAQIVFETAARTNRLGLRGMRERVQVFGGTLEIESAAEKGTALFVRIPLTRREWEGASQ
jgi:PAS domain S-box-containing protein